MFVRAKLIQAAWRLPLVPPPFNLFGLPVRFGVLVYTAVSKRLRPAQAAAPEADSGETSPALSQNIFHRALKYVNSHRADANPEQRHRVQMVRAQYDQLEVLKAIKRMLEAQQKQAEAATAATSAKAADSIDDNAAGTSRAS